MTKPLSAAFMASLKQPSKKPSPVVATVTIPLGPDECPEERGQDALLWCRKNGIITRWLDRGKWGIVKMAFISISDATMFRLAH